MTTVLLLAINGNIVGKVKTIAEANNFLGVKASWHRFTAKVDGNNVVLLPRLDKFSQEYATL